MLNAEWLGGGVRDFIHHSSFRISAKLPRMLRRVARALRRLLFVLGVASLAWAPASLYYAVVLKGPWPGAGSALMSTEAAVMLALFPGNWSSRLAFEASIQRVNFSDWSEISVWPVVELEPYLWIELPLWLLAALCLAWPVTSFIIARRKHKRGFAIELAEADSSGAPKGHP